MVIDQATLFPDIFVNLVLEFVPDSLVHNMVLVHHSDIVGLY